MISPHEGNSHNPDIIPPTIDRAASAASTIGDVSVRGALDTEVANASTTEQDLPPADSVPSLMPYLRHIASTHEHRYDESNTVYANLRTANATPEEKRTPEQTQLLEDVATMKKFAPYAFMYEEVYTPDELHGLAEKFRVLGQKKRKDFAEVESRVLDTLQGNHDTIDLTPAQIRATTERAASSDKGMQWATLEQYATQASKVINRNTDGKARDYFIEVKDPDPKNGRNLTPIYQFVADSYAHEVIGRRIQRLDATIRDSFVLNCRAVNEWYKQAAPVLDALPKDFAVDRFPVAWHVRQMVETMNIRLQGGEPRGRNKDYRLDPRGAMKLQLLIAHTVENIKTKLRGNDSDLEIVPLD